MNSFIFESLESREMLSVVGWPAAPFSGGNLRGAIHVNQFGDAVIKRRSPAGVFDGYDLIYDDPGPLSIHTSGRATDLAYFAGSGQPTSVDARGSTGQIDVNVAGSKRMQFVGVRPRGSGTYRLRIDGPGATFFDTISISKRLNAGASGSDISGGADYDFYRFTVPRSGNWEVRAIPDRRHIPLDATMNVFDLKGKPVGGSYTRPIDRGGPGVTERWLGIGLSAGATYLVRVDGAGAILGGYGISVSLALGPDVSIRAIGARAGHLDGLGQFKVLRTDNSARPLTVHYKIMGTAKPGVDYVKLTGSVTILGNRLWAGIDVLPLPGAGGGKTVVLTLLPGEGYNLFPRSRASLTIL